MTRRHPEPATAEISRGSDGFALALALLTIAGWVDALGYVQWHGVYASFMSGNTTVMGAATAAGDLAAALEAGRAVLAFVVGVVAGEVLRAFTGRWDRSVVLSAESLLLWLAFWAAASGRGSVATATMTGVAMGIQTAVLHTVGGVAVSLTFVTGTLVNVGRGIVRALLGEAPWRGALAYVALWGALGAGAALGVIVAETSTPRALCVAASLATILAAVSGAATWINSRPGS